MKRLILTLVMAVIATIGMAQTTKDVVKLKNGSIVKGTITEMKPNQNLKIETSDGSIFVFAMNDVIEVTKETAPAPEPPIPAVVPQTISKAVTIGNNEDMCIKGSDDARMFYKGAGSLSVATWATTFLVSPVIGLIPAAIGASSNPTQSQLNVPNEDLYWHNSEYRNCYDRQAMNIKKDKAWDAWKDAAGLWLGLSVAISSVYLGILLFY